MSIAYYVGFSRHPTLLELDQFMKVHGFLIEPAGQRRGKFTRVYFLGNDSVDREIEFFYDDPPKLGNRESFRGRGLDIIAYGNLKTFSTIPTHPDIEERLRIIKEKNVKTQLEYYQHLDPERLRFYLIALALRDHYDAAVVSEQTGELIDPDQPFPLPLITLPRKSRLAL